MQANEGEFYSFNSELCTSLKKISFNSILQSIKYDYTALNNDPIGKLQQVFQNNKNLIYKSGTTISNLSGFYYNPTYASDEIPHGYIPKSSEAGTLTSDLITITITPGFRVIFNFTNNNDPPVPLTSDMFTFSLDYLNNPEQSQNIKSTLDFNKWTQFTPSTMLNVCNKVSKSQFYYSLLGYTSTNDSTDKSFVAPMTNFDAAGNLNAQVVCSLRLINSYYTGPCLSVWLPDQTKPVDIPFDKTTGMISYKSISELFSADTTPVPLRINKFYNQMEQGKTPTMYFLETNGKGPTLTSYCSTAQKIKVYYVEWTTGQYLQLQGDINTSASNINSPAFTVLTSAGLKQNTSDCEIKQTTKESFSNSYNGSFVSSYNNSYEGSYGSSDDHTDVNIISSPMFNITVRDKTTLVLVDNIDTLPLEQTVDFPQPFPSKQSDVNNNYFKTLSVLIPYKSSLNISATYSVNTATQNPLKPIIKGKTATTPATVTTWFSANNKNFGTIVMSELIIFMTDGVNVDQKIVNNVSTDNYNIWNNDIQLMSPDLRCNSTVPQACELDKTNPICACYPSYINNSSRFVDNLTTNMNKAGLVNTDPWCINPACASSSAYKNPSTKASSTCSSVCSAALFANPAKYADLSIKDTQLLTTCSNQSSLGGNTSACNNGDPCPSGTTCSIDKNGSPACIKLTACSTVCQDGFQCVINNGFQQCVPVSNSTQKCSSDGDCNSGQYCDSSLKLCLQTVKQPNILITFGIFLGVIVIGLGAYVAYKKIKKQPFTIKPNKNSHLYIILVITGIIFALIYYYGFNKSETFQSSQYQCSNNSDCAVNSRCVQNGCRCNIGLDNNCKIDINVISETLPYLPPCTTSGTYYYSTVLNGDIYVFAHWCNFKFDGDKWQEIEKLNLSGVGYNQPGFAPYKSAINIVDEKLLTGFNTNMCVTYKNLVYIFVPDYTYLNSNKHVNDDSGEVIKNKSFLLEYNPINDATLTGDINNPAGWTPMKAVSDDPVFSNITINCPIACGSINPKNNVITVLVNNNIYIFGGVMSDDGNVNNNVGIFNIDTKTIIVQPLTEVTGKYTYANFSQGFSSTDQNIIYIVGIINDGKASIYSYDILQKSFTAIAECPTGLYRPGWAPYTGGVTCNYYTKTDTTKTSREHISFLTWNPAYATIANPQIGWDVVLPIQSSKLPSKSIPVTLYTKSKNTGNVTVMNNMIAPLIPQDPLAPLINPPNFLYISAMMTTFYLNGFKFIITGVGDIYRWSDYTETDSKTNIVPCYGVALHQDPVYNKTQNALKAGYGWSDKLGAYYKFGPTSVDIDCRNDGLLCSGNCVAKSSGTTCGAGWNTNITGKCSKSAAPADKCAVVCELTENISEGDYYCPGGTINYIQCTTPGGCPSSDANGWQATVEGSTSCQNNSNNVGKYCII
jgi:hypothetical protein